MITVGETALYRLRITDPGDTITVTIDGEFPYTLDQDGSIWTLNVTLSSLVEFNFTVIATDSFNATSAITPQVCSYYATIKFLVFKILNNFINEVFCFQIAFFYHLHWSIYFIR